MLSLSQAEIYTHSPIGQFKSLKERRDSFCVRLEELKQIASNCNEKIMMGVDTSYHSNLYKDVHQNIIFFEGIVESLNKDIKEVLQEVVIYG